MATTRNPGTPRTTRTRATGSGGSPTPDPLLDPDAMPNYAHAWEFNGRVFIVSLSWAVSNGRLEPVGVEIRNGEEGRPPAPITAEMLGRVPIGRLIRESRAGFSVIAERTPSPTVLRALRAGRGIALTSEDLEAVAEIYRDARKRGLKPPRQAIAEQFGIATSTAAKRIAAARAAGFLGAAIPGKAGEVEG